MTKLSPLQSVFKATALSLAIILTLNPLVIAAADLTVAPNSGNTQVTQAANGVPMVNINAANANGLSHNKFTDYNVGKQGLILNNNANKYTQTQLGGTIEFNPNMKGGRAATTILNEVTSGNASRLQGYTEVAGQQAHVIVANPNGVTCSGCGFINTPRVTVTTGKPIIENGQINRYDVTQGKVTIEGDGLNAGNISQFDIIARSAEINAEIHAQQLNIIAGRNEVTNKELTVLAKVAIEDDPYKPQLAIDSSALGGMYAGAIRLVGTEKGVGVNLAGDMASHAGNIQLDANGKLTVAGTVASNKDFIAKAEQVELNNAIYASDNIAITTTQQTTVNNSLASGNNLTLQANNITNKGIIEAGASKTGDGNNKQAKLTLVANQVDNQGKNITSRGSLEINTEALQNQQGKIVSKVDTKVIAKTINNQQATIAAEGKLTTTADTLNNQQGNIIGQQAVTLTTPTIDNSNQGLIYSEQGDITIQAATVNNQHGNIAGQNFTATIETLTNQLGLIEAAKAINYQGETLNNNYGVMHGLGKQDSQINLTGLFNNEQGTLGVNSDAFTLNAALINNAEGTIQHMGDKGLIMDYDLLGLAGGQLITQSAIHIDQEDWYNNTKIQAANLTLNVKNLTQDSAGALYLTEALNIAEGGDWYNDGLIQTNEQINLNLLGDYWGTGQLLSEKNINLTAQNIITEGVNSRIHSNGELLLTANDTFHNEGNILSNNTLQITATDSYNTGTIGTSQDLAITSETLHNQDGLIFTGAKLTIKADDFYNQRGDLFSQGDINLTGYSQQAMNSLINHSATIESLAKIFINADILENAREIFTIETHKISAHVQDAGCSHDCGGDKKDHNFILTEIDRTEVTEASAESRIVAADDLTIQSKQIDNKMSVLASGNNIQIDTDTFNNIGAQTADVTTKRFLMTWRMSSLAGVFNLANTINQYDNIDSPTYNPNRNIEGDVASFTSPLVMFMDNITEGPTATNVQVHSGIVQAAGNITINAKDGEIANNSIKPSYIYTSGGNRVQDTTTSGNEISTYVPVNPQLEPDTTHQATDPLNLPGFKLPTTINGLFHISTNPNHNYLIETNPAFGVKAFINSDYLLGKLGYDPDEAQRRLGDGMYEQRLIQQAIMARTGQYFVHGITDGDTLYRYLMDNALASKEALNLTLGVALTAEQVAALTHDIVWLEEREVEGHQVLVPIVYMAQTAGRLAPTGSLIQGYDLTLITGGNLINSGTLKADNNLQTRAQNIINSGLFEGNQLAVTAEQNIINTQGGVIKGQSVQLVAEQGSVINERDITTHQLTDNNTYKRKDFVSNASSIESEGDLDITAGQHIINEGSNIKAQNAALNAQGNILITSTEENEQRTIAGKKSYYNQTTKQHGSQIDITGNLTANAGENIQVTASKVKVGENANFTAGQDITFNAAANEDHSSSKSKTLTTQYDSIKQQQSEIDVGNLTVSAGNDINLGAATFTTDEAYFYATNEIKAEAQQDSTYYLYDKKTGGSGAFSKKATKRDEVTDIKNISATFNTNGNLTFESGSNQTYQAITINTPQGETTGVVTFDSGGRIVFESVKDYHQESHERSKSDWSWNSAKGKGQTDETFKQTTIIGNAPVVIKAVDGLQIDIKDNGITPQTVSQAIDAMVKADPSLAWIKEAEQRGDVDYKRVKEIHDQWEYSNSGLGVGASLVIAIAAAAVATVAVTAALTAAPAGAAAAGTGVTAAGTTATAGAATAGTAATGAAASTTAAATAGAATTTATATVGTAAGTSATVATGTAVASGGAVAGSGLGVIGSMGVAAVGSVAGTGAVSLINNKGDLGATLKDTFSSEKLKDYLVASATAGITAGIFGNVGNADPYNKTFNPSAGLDSIEGLGTFLGNQLVQNTSTAALNKVLGRDADWSEALKNSLYNTITAGAFNAVGDLGVKWDIDGTPIKTGMHAIVGGAVNEMLGGDFKDGAMAAGINEAISGVIFDKGGITNSSYQQAVSNIIGVVSGGLTGADDRDLAQIGGITKDATAYNYLNHKDVKELEKRLKDCAGNTKCESEAEVWANARSMENQERLKNCATNGNCIVIAQEIQEGMDALNNLTGLNENAEAIIYYQKNTQSREQEAANLNVVKETIVKPSNQRTEQENKIYEKWLVDNPNEAQKLIDYEAKVKLTQDKLTEALALAQQLEQNKAFYQELMGENYYAYQQQLQITITDIKTGMEMAGAMLEPDWIDLAGPLAKLAGFINDVRKLSKVGSVGSDLSKELNTLQKLESELTAMSNGVYDAKKVEAYAKETSTYKDLKKAEESLTAFPELPVGYSKGKSTGAVFNETGGLPAGYRRVVSDKGDIVVQGVDGKIYTELGNGTLGPKWVSDFSKPNDRHYFNKVTQGSVVKDKNTIILPNVDVSKDMSAIRNGEGVFKGNTVTVNNRTYEAHANGTLYPISGDGLITLTKGEYKALSVYQKLGSTPTANLALDNMKDVSKQDIKKAYEIWSNWK